MKVVRQGLVILSCIYIALAWIVGCAHVHQVIFRNDACIKPYKGYYYHTCQPMRVTIDGKKFTVPKDFQTDLASIPRLLWPILAPQYSGFVAPAILHDYLYRCNTVVTRQFADEVLYSALLAEDVSRFTASKFYLAVRIFGSTHFGQYSRTCL